MSVLKRKDLIGARISGVYEIALPYDTKSGFQDFQERRILVELDSG